MALLLGVTGKKDVNAASTGIIKQCAQQCEKIVQLHFMPAFYGVCKNAAHAKTYTTFYAAAAKHASTAHAHKTKQQSNRQCGSTNIELISSAHIFNNKPYHKTGPAPLNSSPFEYVMKCTAQCREVLGNKKGHTGVNWDVTLYDKELSSKIDVHLTAVKTAIHNAKTHAEVVAAAGLSTHNHHAATTVKPHHK